MNHKSDKPISTETQKALVLTLGENVKSDLILTNTTDLNKLDDILTTKDHVQLTLIENQNNPTSVFFKTIIHLSKHYTVYDNDEHPYDSNKKVKRLRLDLVFQNKRME